MDEYSEEKRTEKNLIVRSDKYPKEVSEAKTTTNKRLRSTFCIEAIQTQRRAASLRQQSFLLAVGTATIASLPMTMSSTSPA